MPPAYASTKAASMTLLRKPWPNISGAWMKRRNTAPAPHTESTSRRPIRKT